MQRVRDLGSLIHNRMSPSNSSSPGSGNLTAKEAERGREPERMEDIKEMRHSTSPEWMNI